MCERRGQEGCIHRWLRSGLGKERPAAAAKRKRGAGRLLKTLLAVFLIATAAAQTPEKECPRQTQMLSSLAKDLRQLARTLPPDAAQSAPILIGVPTLTPAQPVRIMRPPLKQMANK